MSAVDRSPPGGPERPALHNRTRVLALRALPAACLLLAAVAAVVYGATKHVHDVLVEEVVELPPYLVQTPFGVPADQIPGYQIPTQTELFPVPHREPILVREVTYGGVKRLVTGELMRTYSGDAPSACPT